MRNYWLVFDLMRNPRGLLPLLPWAVAVAAIVIWATSRRGLTRGQLERFAMRQRLAVTLENGAFLVRALSVSFRWRRIGLALGLLLGVAAVLIAGVPDARVVISINYSAMFLGWFAGALIGEWRIASKRVAVGAHRVAGLTTRSVALYVTRSNRIVLAVALLVLAAFAGYGVFFEPLRSGHGVRWPFLVVLAATTIVLWATFKRVTGRPQPFVGEDERHADDALRGHSLTVLVGCVIAAAGCLIFQIVSGASLGNVGLSVFAVAAAAGWWVATWSTSARAKSLEARPAGGRFAIEKGSES